MLLRGGRNAIRLVQTSAFDPQQWMHRLMPQHIENSPRNLLKLLLEYILLSPEHRTSVKSVASGAFHANLQLHSMLTGASQMLVFQFIAAKAPTKEILPELSERFLFDLLAVDNLNAATALTHILMAADPDHYRLSNQFWSLLASKAARKCHNAAAMLVYHEIINPYQKFMASDTLPSEENELIPFLLLPSTIEALTHIFVQNANQAAVDGLYSYFKRFYSYFGHRDVYETLAIAKVEVLAKSGDLSATLKAFDDLAPKYRGHLKYRDPKDISHSLKYASHVNFKERQRRIEQNLSNDHIPLDEFQQKLAAESGLKTFQPDIVYNKYSIKGKSRFAILDGYLRVEDLPNFQFLLQKSLSSLLSENVSVMDRLVSFVSSHNHTLSKFLIVSLCELGHGLEASAMMSKIPSIFPFYYKRPNFSTSEEFCCIFRALRANLASNGIEPTEYHQLVQQNYGLCEQLHRHRGCIPPNCLRSYLYAYLSSPYAEKHEVERLLRSSGYLAKPRFTLDKEAHQKACDLDVDSLFASETFSLKLF